MEGEDSPQTRKGLPEIQEEWKRELFAKSAGIQTPTSWHCSQGGSNMLRSAVGTWHPMYGPCTHKGFHSPSIFRKQQCPNTWKDHEDKGIGCLSLEADGQPLEVPQILLMSQTWHWVRPETLNQIHEAEARGGGQCKGGILRMAEY